MSNPRRRTRRTLQTQETWDVSQLGGPHDGHKADTQLSDRSRLGRKTRESSSRQRDAAGSNGCRLGSPVIHSSVLDVLVYPDVSFALNLLRTVCSTCACECGQFFISSSKNEMRKRARDNVGECKGEARCYKTARERRGSAADLDNQYTQRRRAGELNVDWSSNDLQILRRKSGPSKEPSR